MKQLNGFLVIEENDNLDEIMYREPLATWHTLKTDHINISRPKKLPAYYTLTGTNYRGDEEHYTWDNLWFECSKETFIEHLAESIEKHKKESENFERLTRKERNLADNLTILSTY